MMSRVHAAPPLRLAYVADPNSTHTRRWIAFFARQGHEVHLLDGFGTELAPGLDERIRVHRYDGSPAARFPGASVTRARANLRKLLDQVRPDVLHAFFVRRYGWQAAVSGFHPLVVSPWGSDLLRVAPSALRARLWNWWALHSADVVTVSSDWMRTVSERSGARRDRVQVVPHGVDTVRFAPGPIDSALRERLRTDGSPVVASLRAIRPLYRHDVVVEALAEPQLRSRRPIVVMSARGADPVHLASLEARADQLGVSGQLRILDDVSHDELPALLRLADVVLSVPETDSLPLTVLEAMACGRPIVVSDLPAVTPVVSHVDPLATGLIAPVGDAAATAAAIDRALALQPAEKAALGAAFRELVVKTADYETSMARMEGLYRALVPA
jgi:glycosyltransferase involved in cell wall biosynthesis